MSHKKSITLVLNYLVGDRFCILIANAGSSKLNGKSYDYVKEVAGQIVQAENYDKTIVGVMGWPTSGFAQAAIPVLASAHIPTITTPLNRLR